MDHSTDGWCSDSRRIALEALEQVCSGAGTASSAKYYSPTFLDHVNGIEFHGLTGVQRSVDRYRSILSDLRIVVHDQIADGDRVASRFVVSGVSRGRHVTFDGITISRLENGLIVEDWSVTIRWECCAKWAAQDTLGPHPPMACRHEASCLSTLAANLGSVVVANATSMVTMGGTAANRVNQPQSSRSVQPPVAQER